MREIFSNTILWEAIGLIFFGATGALVKDILTDNAITMPKRVNGELYLGFIGSLTIGAIVGYLVDHSIVTAFFAGYTGFSALGHLMPTKMETPTTEITQKLDIAVLKTLDVKDVIVKIAENKKVDTNLALRVANCESSFNIKARNTNKSGSIDRGLYQINNKWHPNVTDEQADDPIFATQFFCDAVNNGNLSWWDASKQCWGIAIKK